MKHNTLNKRIFAIHSIIRYPLRLSFQLFQTKETTVWQKYYCSASLRIVRDFHKASSLITIDWPVPGLSSKFLEPMSSVFPNNDCKGYLTISHTNNLLILNLVIWSWSTTNWFNSENNYSKIKIPFQYSKDCFVADYSADSTQEWF